jgi:hypothetical protein
VAGYLDSYGAGEERREKIRRSIALAVLAALVLGGVLYFLFRNWREDRQARLFLGLLVRQQYPAAYQLWGCSVERPCRDYAYDKFMEDWGPKNPRGDIQAARIVKTRSCATGVIYTLEYGPQEPLLLWVDRKDQALAFAPWPSCNPRMLAPKP